jgi:hypothetical protein
MSWLRRIAKWLGTQFLQIASDEPAASASSGSGGSALAVAAAVPMAVIYIVSGTTGPLRQGEILTDVIQRRRSFRSLSLATPEIDQIRHPYSIVVTQDCDLEQDHTARNGTTTGTDKLIPNVLLVQVVTVKELLAGLPRGKDILKRVIQNRDERYHVFEKAAATQDALGQGLPALGADFKRYFTVPTDELYAQLGSGARRRTQLNSTYVEHFGQRFAAYLSRVALPREHQVE